MATVTFSAADDLLYAYLAGEIDHDAAQNLRIQLDDSPFLARTPQNTGARSGRGGFYGFVRGGADSGPPTLRPTVWAEPLRIQHAPEQLRRVLAAGQYPLHGCRTGGMKMKAENTTRIQFDSLSATKRMPAVRQRLFWPGMTPPCPSWLT